jgi:hypothetical protein
MRAADQFLQSRIHSGLWQYIRKLHLHSKRRLSGFLQHENQLCPLGRQHNRHRQCKSKWRSQPIDEFHLYRRSENYLDAIAAVNLKAGNNTIQIFGGPQGYFKTKKVCVQSSARVGSENYTDDIVVNNESILFTSPNPSSGEFDVSFFLEKSKEAQISVLNNQGIGIYKKHLTGKGMHKEKLILPDNQSGSFILILKKENGVEYSKIVVVE